MSVSRHVAGMLLAAVLPTAAAIEIDSNTFGGLEARAIGPATMSGRIAALDAVPSEPLTIFVGAASGGVWRSTDGGIGFEPVFDAHHQSIGAIAIDDEDPRTIWVGTGESWVRNSVSVGDGIYRSSDGGDSWTHLGLADSERIAAIAIAPSEEEGEASETLFVCATGHLWDDNEERGVYRTTDGGESWQRVLWVDARTGCSDLAIDPQDPSILYAGMWEYRRYPDYFESGGPGSGLFKSVDGGDSWSELTNGLPEGDKGRIAVAVAPSRPSTLYAVVEADETALYRSDDLGLSWREMNRSMNVVMRPFYFARLVVDPTDHEVVYKPGFTFGMSTDGGKSFTSPISSGGFNVAVHPDHHALWVHPERPRTLLLGTDGGMYTSHDRAGNWRHQKNLPISQFYHVSYDMQRPYNVMGGLQDNGTWIGPSRAPGGVANKDWKTIGFGDGFWALVDGTDPDFIYVEYQGGMLMRYRRSADELKQIRPLEQAGDPDYRFNWNTPIHVSRADPGTVYYGGQFLFATTDRGESWTRRSPDLTTDDPERQRQLTSGGLTIDNSTAENNATIYTISDEPGDGDVIWVGTDDGRLQVTTDGGEDWSDVFGNLPGVPAGTWVASVEASAHAAGRAYVVLDGHRTGDMATYLFRTDDHGKTWRSIAGAGEEPQIDGYGWVLREDPLNADLLYLGTEEGLWITIDGGAQWARFAGGLPRVAVHDIAIHPRDHDLIVGTHGRGIYIIDDLTPLRALTDEVLEADVRLLPTRPALMLGDGVADSFGSGDEFVGRNPGNAVDIVYWLKKRHIFGDLRVEIWDGEEKLFELPGGKRKGLNRVQWPMRLAPPKIPAANALVPAFTGPRVPEGTYTVKLIKGKQTLESTVSIEADPASPHDAASRAAQQKAALDAYAKLERLTYVVEAIADLAQQASDRRLAVGGETKLGKALGDFVDAGETFRSSIVATSEAGMLSGEERLREKLGALYGAIVGYDGRPSDTQLARLEVLGGRLADAEARWQEWSGTIGKLNSQLERKEQPVLAPLTRDAWKARAEAGGISSAAVTDALDARSAAKLTHRIGGRPLGW